MGKFAGFTSVELKRPQRSQFDLSHYKRATTRMGRLTPILILESIPSDVFRGGSNVLTRLAPMLAPIYDNMTVFIHYFFIPNRLLMAEWEKFITGGQFGPGGGDPPEAAPIPPYFNTDDFITGDHDAVSSLGDYLGVPNFQGLPGYVNPAEYAGTTIDAMPFAAYQLVWYEYYRDRNFVEDDQVALFGSEFPLSSGVHNPTIGLCNLRTRAYMQDYFTSALPWTQRGAEVLIPVDTSLSGYAPIVGPARDGSIDYWRYANTISPGGGASYGDVVSDPNAPVGALGDFGYANLNDVQNADPGVSATINDLRTAWAMQVWMERNAVGGSRYNESTYVHFGVRPQDARLQRPEFIGGGRIQIRISPIVSTAYSQDSEDATVPLANLGGYGSAYGSANRFSYFCAEHGFIIGICSIMNVPSYQQGIPRMFNRRTFLDYMWPTFAKLGEQQIDKSELFASGANMTPDAAGLRPLFGYTSRYADWKWMPSTNHGEFKTTLLHWHLTRVFASDPELGEEFVLFDETTQDRIFAVNGEDDNFWLYVENEVSVLRALPYFGQPNALGFQ